MRRKKVKKVSEILLTVEDYFDRIISALLRAGQSGEVSEWFKELVLKTSDSERDRGFESHLLRLKGIISQAQTARGELQILSL